MAQFFFCHVLDSADGTCRTLILVLKDRLDMVIEIVAVTAMVYAGSAVLGRAMRTQTWAQMESVPGLGAVALGLKALRKEAVS